MVIKDVVDIQDDNVIILSDKRAVEKGYQGTYADLSSDEEVALIKHLQEKPWTQVVAEQYAENSNWLYQIITDLGRNAFLEVLTLPKDGVFLDVGSGWGQISVPLAQNGHTVALDLTKNRLDILEEIEKQEKVEIMKAQGNFLTFPFSRNSFDLIVFNGSLEWIAVGRNKQESIREIQIKCLSKARELLQDGGEIYIGIENSLGLKYLLGAPDDHTGIPYLPIMSEVDAEELYFTANQGQLPAKTWSLNEYKSMAYEAGLEIEKVYGCFPDYKIIRNMIELKDVNQFIQKSQFTSNEHSGIDGTRLSFNKELDAIYKLLSLNGVAHLFCPSYGLIMKPKG